MIAMIMHVLIKNEQDQVHIFEYIYFESFQTHLQAIMYHFERTSHDIPLDFLFQIFSICFLYAYNQHLQCLPCLDYCKNCLF